ncbi:hypothetical protein OG330_30865 (plasmid) [Streptomyces albidoflavus]|nr:hypothetical protein [Streptomyces albidoflavus]WSU19618.1 hypothetical protein OG330_30865 [Streptomyces albidoflavus]
MTEPAPRWVTLLKQLANRDRRLRDARRPPPLRSAPATASTAT